MVLFESLSRVFYWHSIVTIAVCCIVSEIKWDIGQKSRLFHTPLQSTPQFGGPRHFTCSAVSIKYRRVTSCDSIASRGKKNPSGFVLQQHRKGGYDFRGFCPPRLSSYRWWLSRVRRRPWIDNRSSVVRYCLFDYFVSQICLHLLAGPTPQHTPRATEISQKELVLLTCLVRRTRSSHAFSFACCVTCNIHTL